MPILLLKKLSFEELTNLSKIIQPVKEEFGVETLTV